MLATRVFWVLVSAFVAVVGSRAFLWGIHADDIDVEHVYQFEENFAVHAAPGAYALSVYIPHENARVKLLDERFEAGAASIRLEENIRGRRMLIDGPKLSAPIVRYSATVLAQPIRYELKPTLSWDDVGASEDEHLKGTQLIQVNEPRVQRLLAQLLGMEAWLGQGDRETADVDTWRSAVQEREIPPLRAVTAIFDHCQHGISPATFSGSTDALTTLCLGAASCGGKSRLMAAMCRAMGIPARIVGGVILGDDERKRASHVWLECLIAGEWVPFDPLNNHFASLPANYLTLYRGDVPLIQHSRGLAFDYAFASHLDRVPNAWVRENLAEAPDLEREMRENPRHVPLLQRQEFSLIILAPFAMLFVVFCRQVVGIESMGVFLPTLLGFSITQTGWLIGGGQLLLAVLIGIGLRFSLSRLSVLHVPRIAILITFLVVLFLAFSVILEAMGISRARGAAILPLAALAMTVERYTLVAMDKGHRGALSLILQTSFLAGACYFVLTTTFLKSLIVSFPEVLLLVVAELVMIGQYRGLRLRELWRFRAIRSAAA